MNFRVLLKLQKVIVRKIKIQSAWFYFSFIENMAID